LLCAKIQIPIYGYEKGTLLEMPPKRGGYLLLKKWRIKMKFLKKHLKQLAIGLGCFMAASTIAARAEDIPTLNAIVSDVARATMPARNYSATVHQKVFQADALTSPSAKAISASALSASTNEIEEADFTVNGETTGAFRVTKGISLKRMVQSTNVASKAAAPAQNMRLMLTVNPMNALRHIEKLKSATVTNDLYQGIPCYKISATDGRFGFVLWVNKTNSAVCHQIILQDSNTLLETDFEYKKWNGILVSTHTTIFKPSNDTRIDQEFSGHSY
jgi:hypothetical protein